MSHQTSSSLSTASPAAPLTEASLLATFMTYGRPPSSFLVGGEFERAVVRPDGRSVGYDDPNGIRWILEQIHARQPGWVPEREGDNLIALVRENGASITLEPGGQVELSGAPHPTVAELAVEMRANRQVLLDIAEGHDLRWTATGLTPIMPIADIGWMPKGRYVIMREYLPQFGDLAHWMMKGTCSVQANFDYVDEADCARKVRLCAGVAPLTTALFANSPLSENKPTGYLSTRGHVWTRTDPARTGFPPGLRADYTHARWVQYLLDVPMMFYKRAGQWQPANGTTFRTWMDHGIEGCFPTAADWDLHQTSVFPEVRIKRTIEVRGADCVGQDLALAFCALFTGLLYDEGAMDAGLALVDDIERHGNRDSRLAAACEAGLGATVDGARMQDWATELGAIAQRGLSAREPESAHLLAPLLERIASGRSPGVDVLEAWHRDPSPEAVIASVAY